MLIARPIGSREETDWKLITFSWQGYNDGVCEGDRVNGMLHGKGWRIYEKQKSWMGTLLPYGCLMNTLDPPKSSRVITYERFQNEPGILSRFDKPIVLVHGKNSIKVRHCPWNVAPHSAVHSMNQALLLAHRIDS